MGNSSIKAAVRNLDCSIAEGFREQMTAARSFTEQVTAEGFTEQVTIFRRVVKIWIRIAFSDNGHPLSKTDRQHLNKMDLLNRQKY